LSDIYLIWPLLDAIGSLIGAAVMIMVYIAYAWLKDHAHVKHVRIVRT